MERVAILVDGGFYQRRAQTVWGSKSPEARADELHRYCLRHLSDKVDGIKVKNDLYRIFYYDCPPCGKRVYHPLLKKQVDLSKTPLYDYMTRFHEAIRSKRKTALRLGELSDRYTQYILFPDAAKKLIIGVRNIQDLTETDFTLDIKQKGVDIRIGLDIASMAYKKQVTKIVLISGDSDFVPAAKLARREGVDFVLDPMYATIKPSLSEHIDGIRSCFSQTQNTVADNRIARVED